VGLTGRYGRSHSGGPVAFGLPVQVVAGQRAFQQRFGTGLGGWVDVGAAEALGGLLLGQFLGDDRFQHVAEVGPDRLADDVENLVAEGIVLLNRTAHYGRSGLIVSGPARTGKTTALTQLGKTIEVIHRRRHPRSPGDIPVVYITVPPAATPRMIATEFARFFGLPVSRRSNITDIIEPVCGVGLDTRVTLVSVDELHNLNTTTRAGAEASDTLKYFSERIPATCRLCRDQPAAHRAALRNQRRADRRPIRHDPHRGVQPGRAVDRADRGT
jgi:hypothetical protein